MNYEKEEFEILVDHLKRNVAKMGLAEPENSDLLVNVQGKLQASIIDRLVQLEDRVERLLEQKTQNL